MVNDITAYPEFLPWCRGTEVRDQSDAHLLATVTLEAGRFKQSFTTENTMQPGRRIEMRLVAGPFKSLTGCWQFEAAGPDACQIILDIQFEFRNKLLKLALQRTFHHILENLVDSFSKRAITIYGQR